MTSRTAAKRYARALIDVALAEHADLEQIERDLAGFVALFAQHPALEKAMLNPAVPVPNKRTVMAELLARGGLLPIVAKLLTLLADRDRLVLLPDLLDAYRERLLAHRNVVRATVTTATEISPERARAIQQQLAKVTGKTVTIDTAVDPSIIGGLVARIGGTVYDGSITRQLEKMKQRLTESM